MVGRSVALVAGPSEGSELAVEVGHDFVPMHLGEHRRGGDRGALLVPFTTSWSRSDRVTEFAAARRRQGRRPGVPQEIEGSVDQRVGRPRARRPSIARVAATASARRSPHASISAALTDPSDQSAAHALERLDERLRRGGVRNFESSRSPGGWRRNASATTAPTVSGPARAPRPTSSMPTTTSPRASSGRSKASRSTVDGHHSRVVSVGAP